MSNSPILNGRGGGTLFDMRRYFARNLRVYYLFEATSGFLIWMPIWMIYMIDGRGMSLTQVATMESVFWITVVLVEVPTGAVADRWGRRVSLFLGSCGFVIASVAFAFADDYVGLTISYTIMAVSMTLHSGAGQALLFDTLRCLGRTHEYERHVGRAEALSFATMVAAMLLGGPLTALLGFVNTILLGAATMGGACIAALLLREPPRREAEFGAEPGAELAAQPGMSVDEAAEGRESVTRNMLVGWLTIWRRKTLLAIIAFATLMIVLFEVPDFFLQPFVRAQGVDPREAVGSGLAYSALLIPPIVGLMIGSLLASAVVRRLGERRALPLLLAAGIGLFVPTVIWDSLWVISAIGLLAVLHGMTRPIATGYINRRIRSEQRATVLSMYELSTALLMAGCVATMGGVVDNLGFQWAFGLCIALLAVGGGLLAVAWRRAHAREQARNGIALNSVPAPQAGGSVNGAAAHGEGGGAQAMISRSRRSTTAAEAKPSEASKSSLS